MKKFIITVFILLNSALADKAPVILETDWLQPEIGSTGDQLGAKVNKISNNTVDSTIAIDISIPVDDAEKFDTIEVISKESDTQMNQMQPHRWLDDYENGNYGLRIFLKRNPRAGFRIRLIDSDNEKN